MINAAKLDILQLVWTTDSQQVAVASADCNAYLFDLETSSKIKTMKHYDVVNGLATTREGSNMFLTASDDRKACFWDQRINLPTSTIDFPYQLTTCALASDGRLAFVAGIDETIYCFDTRSSEPLFYMQGHKDIITSINLSSDGSTLLSSAMDQTLRTWDARLASPMSTDSNPKANGEVRALGQYVHEHHDAAWQLLRCEFNNDASKIGVGSAQGSVLIWDTASFQLEYNLPGHKAHVNQVTFHPKQNIIASASSDQTIIVSEF